MISKRLSGGGGGSVRLPYEDIKHRPDIEVEETAQQGWTTEMVK